MHLRSDETMDDLSRDRVFSEQTSLSERCDEFTMLITDVLISK